jgi:phage gp29-like protein
VWFKKNGIKFWAIFLDKFSMPTPVGKYPSGTDTDAQTKLLTAIGAIQKETGIIIPENMMLEFLEASRRGDATYPQFCEYWDKQISKRVLGQVATTEGTPGKLGEEKGQNDTRNDVGKADADLLSACHNESFIKWLVDYNFGPQKAYPKIWRRCEPEEDLNARAQRDKLIFVDMNMAHRVPESYITDTYGIPLAEEGEPTCSSPPTGIQKQESREAGSGAAPAPEEPEMSPQFVESRATKLDQLILDRMITAVLKSAPEASKGLSKPIQEAIEKADSPQGGTSGYEEIRTNLAATFSEMDPAQFEDLVARAIFAAQMFGRYVANKESEQ